MVVWSIQPVAVYEKLMEDGVYRCDPEKIEFFDDENFRRCYDWLVSKMEEKIGKRPDGVTYPVWAWLKKGERNRPDLRHERWNCGRKGERFVCMEIEIPDEKVVLSDFDTWSTMLSNSLVSWSEEEDHELKLQYLFLSDEERKIFKEKN